MQKTRTNNHVDKTGNCSRYRKIDTRAGYTPLSTHTIDKYLSSRTIKYLNLIRNDYTVEASTGKADKPSNKVYNGTIYIIFYKHLRAVSRTYLESRLSKVTSLNQLRQLLNTNTADAKEENGNIKRKTTEPTGKTVRPSSRGNQNFEAARCFKSRIRKNAIKSKRNGNKTKNKYSSIEYKILDKTPAAQHQRKRHNNNITKLKTKQSKAVRTSSRGNQNFEAARCYLSLIHI